MNTPDDERRVLPAVSRRQWIGAISASLCFASQNTGAPGSCSAQDVKQLPYIDAHSHVWSSNVERWPLAGNQTKNDLQPPSFVPEELLALAEPDGVGRVVLIQHS